MAEKRVLGGGRGGADSVTLVPAHHDGHTEVCFVITHRVVLFYFVRFSVWVMLHQYIYVLLLLFFKVIIALT